uniref:RT10103p n=1 Tax=Drosophila melanogaster TaxID=7227 RepID=E1NZD9_DROME|nr:RT10103p [Drosophila melanogaster]
MEDNSFNCLLLERLRCSRFVFPLKAPLSTRLSRWAPVSSKCLSSRRPEKAPEEITSKSFWPMFSCSRRPNR